LPPDKGAARLSQRVQREGKSGLAQQISAEENQSRMVKVQGGNPGNAGKGASGHGPGRKNPKHPGTKKFSSFKGGGGKGPGAGIKPKFTRHLKHKPNMKQRRKMREAKEADGGSPHAQINGSNNERGRNQNDAGKKRKFPKAQGDQRTKKPMLGKPGQGKKVENQGPKEHGKPKSAASPVPRAPASSNPKVAKLKRVLQEKLGRQPEAGETPAELKSDQEANPSTEQQPKKPAVAAISSNWLAL